MGRERSMGTPLWSWTPLRYLSRAQRLASTPQVKPMNTWLNSSSALKTYIREPDGLPHRRDSDQGLVILEIGWSTGERCRLVSLTPRLRLLAVGNWRQHSTHQPDLYWPFCSHRCKFWDVIKHHPKHSCETDGDLWLRLIPIGPFRLAGLTLARFELTRKVTSLPHQVRRTNTNRYLWTRLKTSVHMPIRTTL